MSTHFRYSPMVISKYLSHNHIKSWITFIYLQNNYVNMDIQIGNIILQLQQDDKYAFKQLYEQYYSRVVAFIVGMIKKEDIANDLAQDVFVNLWLGRKRLDISQNLQNYIFVASRNAAINYLRKELAHVHEQIETVQEKIYAESNIEDSIFAREINLLIEMVVSEMPKQRQLIYRMSREEGLSNNEIANKLEISKRSVENQLSIALKEIRQSILIYIIFLLYMLS